MSYNECESAVATLLQSLDRFGDDQVTRGDDRAIDLMLRNRPSGVANTDNVAILYPGVFQLIEQSQNRYTWHWHIQVWLLYKYQIPSDNAAATWTQFRAMRQDVIDQIKKYPQLNQTAAEIHLVELRADTEPEEIFRELPAPGQKKKPDYIGQRIVVMVEEMEDVTYG